MGLDMYLRAEKYVSGWQHNRDEKEHALYRDILERVDMTAFATDDSPSLTVTVPCAYWRKANHIHQWFVDNVQDGTDDCKPYYVSREQLQELRRHCADLLVVYSSNQHAATAMAEERLPTQSGFFFGSTDVDEWYWQDVRDTVAQLDRVLALPDNCEFYYESSW